MEHEKSLKVGDRLYHEEYPRIFSLPNYLEYQFATVIRLTKTQAILSNGVKLINEPINASHRTDIFITGYCVHGDRWEKWIPETPEAIEESKKQELRLEIQRWFANKNFSEQEKTLVYNLFKNNQHQDEKKII